MKKRGKNDEKKKEFSSSPFKGLKTFAVEADRSPTKDTAKAESVSEPLEESDDSDLFLRYVEGVERLHDSAPPKRDHSKRKESTVAPQDDERQLFLSSLAGMDVTFRDEFPDVEPLKPLAINRMRQLKNGSIRLDLELDLHGLTRDEALNSLSRFITGAYNRGQKAVLVITGKGNNSPAEPVLQGAVASWLREAGKSQVAEFAPAPRTMGGNGAFVVFLKEKKN